MHRRPKLIQTLLALVALGAIAVIASGCGTTTADSERGRVLFTKKCANCHGLAEAGATSTIGPDLDAAFGPARATGMDGATIEGVVRAQVLHPRPDNGNPAVSMPADIVTGQDLEDVAAYIGEWAGVPGAEPPKVPGGPGAQVFANNGCGGCHILAAADAGGTTGPNLDEVLSPADSVAHVTEMIVEPNAELAPGYPPDVMPQNYGETLSEKELEDLVKFLIENAGKQGSSGG